MTRWGPIEALDVEMRDRMASMQEGLTVAHSEAKRLREERDEVSEELHLMKTAGIIEVAVRNPSVMEYMQHWEGRAEKAEEELAKVREVNAEQASQVTYWRDRAHHAEDQLRRAQQDKLRMARAGE